MSNNSNVVIQQLLAVKGLKVECPHCEEVSPIHRLKLFGMKDKYPKFAQDIINERMTQVEEGREYVKDRKKELANNKKKKPEKVSIATEATNFGQISEQIIPAFKNFPFNQRDCRALFKPVDYLIFNNWTSQTLLDT